MVENIGGSRRIRDQRRGESGTLAGEDGLLPSSDADDDAGADTMAGGLGNDTYVVDYVGDIIVENANEGVDTVQTNLASCIPGEHVENLISTTTTAFDRVGNGVVEFDTVLGVGLSTARGVA